MYCADVADRVSARVCWIGCGARALQAGYQPEYAGSYVVRGILDAVVPDRLTRRRVRDAAPYNGKPIHSANLNTMQNRQNSRIAVPCSGSFA